MNIKKFHDLTHHQTKTEKFYYQFYSFLVKLKTSLFPTLLDRILFNYLKLSQFLIKLIK